MFSHVLQTFRHSSFNIVTHRFTSLVPSMSPQNPKGLASSSRKFLYLHFTILYPHLQENIFSRLASCGSPQHNQYILIIEVVH